MEGRKDWEIGEKLSDRKRHTVESVPHSTALYLAYTLDNKVLYEGTLTGGELGIKIGHG